MASLFDAKFCVGIADAENFFHILTREMKIQKSIGCGFHRAPVIYDVLSYKFTRRGPFPPSLVKDATFSSQREYRMTWAPPARDPDNCTLNPFMAEAPDLCRLCRLVALPVEAKSGESPGPFSGLTGGHAE